MDHRCMGIRIMDRRSITARRIRITGAPSFASTSARAIIVGIANLESAVRLLSTPFHKYDHVCCVDFRFWRGATREHPPKWGCDRGATKPEPKSDATLRAAALFGPDVVAHSLQTLKGMRVARASSGPKIPRRKRGRI